MNRKCNICEKKKVSLGAYLFGLRHCHDCNIAIKKGIARTTLLLEFGPSKKTYDVLDKHFPEEECIFNK